LHQETDDSKFGFWLVRPLSKASDHVLSLGSAPNMFSTGAPRLIGDAQDEKKAIKKTLTQVV
jgi:hypothetical protein